MGSDPGVADTLSAEGYVVDVADDGPGMVAMLGARRHQVVLVDLDLPGGKGIEVLETAVNAAGSSRVIACMSKPTTEAAVAAMRAGAFDLLTKPLDKESMLASIRAALEKQKAMQELVSLRKVVDVFSSLQNLENTYAHLRKSIAELFQAQACSLSLLDTESGEIVAQTPEYGQKGDTVPKHRFRLSDSRISKFILETGEPFLTNDAPQDPLFDPARVAKGGLENLLAVPMSTAAGPIGFIYVVNRPGSFSRLDAELLLVIGEQVAIALTHAHSFSEAYNASITDPLTGLYNRRFFDARLRQEVERVNRHSRPLGLMFVDLDHFKQINDVHGHQAGNMVLTQIAKILKQCSRTADVPARWGGDEFTVLLSEAEPDSLEMIARRVRETVLTSDWGPCGAITVTIGIAVLPQDAQTLEDLLRAADDAMYLAKKRGRNTFALAQEAHKESATAQSSGAAHP